MEPEVAVIGIYYTGIIFQPLMLLLLSPLCPGALQQTNNTPLHHPRDEPKGPKGVLLLGKSQCECSERWSWETFPAQPRVK